MRSRSGIAVLVSESTAEEHGLTTNTLRHPATALDYLLYHITLFRFMFSGCTDTHAIMYPVLAYILVIGAVSQCYGVAGAVG